MERTSETKPVTIVAIGAGNRTNKYLEYAIRNPDRLKLVGVAELNDIRRHAVASKFGLKPEECFADYERFFENPVPADAILIGTPENMHFEPCMKAIEAGYNVLLEKPIAQSLPECCRIAEAARRKGVIVGVCHVLRYHPYFIKIKEIVDSGQLGEIISISHLAAVGLDRTTHGFVRGMWRREEITNPMLIYVNVCGNVEGDYTREQIDSQLRRIGMQTIQAVAGSPERLDSIIERLKQQSLGLQKQRDDLLEAAGLLEIYRDDGHVCKRCEDTGYIGSTKCECFQKLLREAAFDALGASHPQDCRFSNFSLDYYSCLLYTSPSPRDS